MSCSVKSCKNLYPLMDKALGISFHLFPREPNLLRKWLQALAIEGEWAWSTSIKVCSKHFLKSDFIYVGEKKNLRAQAVPCLDLDSCPLSSASCKSQNKPIIINLQQTSPTTTLETIIIEDTTSCESESSSISSSAISTVGRKGLSVLKHDMRYSPKSTSRSSSDSVQNLTKTIAVPPPSRYCRSIKRRRFRVVGKPDSISALPSAKKKKSEILAAIYRKKLHIAKYKNKKLKEQVANLQNDINVLRKEQILSENMYKNVMLVLQDANGSTSQKCSKSLIR